MKVTQITVARLYNTMAFTNQRFELTATLEDDDPITDAMRDLAEELDARARVVMQEMGIVQIQEQGGVQRLESTAAAVPGDADDVDEIPF